MYVGNEDTSITALQIDVSNVIGGGGASTSFDSVTTGTNTSATMTVGSGAQIVPAGTGIINATKINGIPITGNLTHAGQIPISQPGNTAAVWADPLVQGISPVGTAVSGINPVLVGAKDNLGKLADLTVDASGNLNVTMTGAGSTNATIVGPVDGSGNVKVSGTFWPVTQPVSNTQLPVALDGSGDLKVAVQNSSLIVAGSVNAALYLGSTPDNF